MLVKLVFFGLSMVYMPFVLDFALFNLNNQKTRGACSMHDLTKEGICLKLGIKKFVTCHKLWLWHKNITDTVCEHLACDYTLTLVNLFI